jgi:hypothetical protein
MSNQVSREKIEFAERAAKFFENNPKYYSFTDGEIRCGAYFAMKQGILDDCVLVFQIGDDPTNFVQFIDRNKVVK